MVVFGHAGDFGLPDIINGGASHCGVLIFFALSGFLMGDLYLRASPDRANIVMYGIARFSRIVPIYYVVILGAFVIYQIEPRFVWAITPVQLLRLLTFNGSVSVFWSIGPEVQFYVVFGGLWLLRAKVRQDLVFGIVTLAISALCLVTIHRWPGIFVASKFHIFAGGMLAALVRPHLATFFSGHVREIAHLVALAALLVFLIPELSDHLLGATPFDRRSDPGFTSFYSNLPRVGLAIFIVFALSFDGAILHRIFANSVASFIGKCSFSVYLLHVAIYDVVTRMGFLKSVTPWIATLSIVALTLGVSAIVHQFVERPLQRFTRRSLFQAVQRSSGLTIQTA